MVKADVRICGCYVRIRAKVKDSVKIRIRIRVRQWQIQWGGKRGASRLSIDWTILNTSGNFAVKNYQLVLKFL